MGGSRSASVHISILHSSMGLSINGGFPPSHHPFLDGIFPKPTILGYPYFRKPPNTHSHFFVSNYRDSHAKKSPRHRQMRKEPGPVKRGWKLRMHGLGRLNGCKDSYYMVNIWLIYGLYVVNIWLIYSNVWLIYG